MTDLTTTQGLQAYLASRSIEPTSIDLLTGGTANYVYRVTLADGKTLIYKHAAPYLHSNHAFPFDPTRMDYENRVLSILPPLLNVQLPASNVHAVGWKSYDGAEKLLCIQDGGATDLKRAYQDARLNVPQIGRDVGTWLAALHTCTTQTSLSPSDATDLKANNPIGVAIYRHAYKNLASALEKFGHDAALGTYIDEEFGSRLATENECVCHGDFWPGNVLVHLAGSSQEEQKDVALTVVDWEMTRRGTSATDVGQFAAEAFLLDRFRGGRGLRPAFLVSYLRARREDGVLLDREWVARMAVHWAVHVAFWPTRVEWADREGTRELVEIGVAVLRAVVGGEWEELGGSEVLAGTGEGWAGILR